MSARDLLKSPIAEAHQLGSPIPESIHAVSVALPRWQDVVGYEEKNPEVIQALQSGYPRFVIHPLVQAMAQQLGGEQTCLPFPSMTSAREAAQFVQRQCGERASVISQRGQAGVVTGAAGGAALRSFWQHTGLIISSRQAEAWHAGRAEGADAPATRASLRQAVAELYGCAAEDVFLAPTGMAAQFAALKAVQQRAPDRGTVQIGFPYVDTLKLQQKLGHGVHLIHDLEHVEAELLRLVNTTVPAACFGEIPGNPLLGSADLRRITPILRQHGIPFVADDVVATPYNVDLSAHADLIATSFTKYIAGRGDVMGGAVICNPRSPYFDQLKPILQAQHEELLWGEDAEVLARNIREFPERMARHNSNGLLIAERLRSHPAIERVWYPKWEFSDMYEAVRKPNAGWGSLITFLPRDAERASPRIYDQLRVCKGPSLGTVFTLACPFTLLAHYTELEWAESCGVSRFLIRVSVGLEDPEELWDRFEAALRHVTSSG